MKYIKSIQQLLSNKLKRYINSIIDDEVIKSQDMSLNIKKNDIEKEKLVIYNIFKNKINDIKSANNSEYSLLVQSINKDVYKELDTECRYYFNISKDGEVRNKYNCHLSSIISRLMIDISNNKIEI